MSEENEKGGIAYKAYKCLEFGGLLFWSGMGILWMSFFAFFYIVINPQEYPALLWYNKYPLFIVLGGGLICMTWLAIKVALSSEEEEEKK